MGKRERKNKKYSAEFKIRVIPGMRGNSLSKRETVRKYWGTESRAEEDLYLGCVKSREGKYLEGGEAGLMAERRGRKSTGRPKKNSDKPIEDAFDGHAELKTLTYSGALTKIGDYAFAGCGALQSIVIPDSVTAIWQYAFAEYLGEELSIPDGVTTIYAYAFDGSNIKFMVLPNIASLGNNGLSLFRNCKQLVWVVLGVHVNTINSTFNGCTALKQLSSAGRSSGLSV